VVITIGYGCFLRNLICFKRRWAVVGRGQVGGENQFRLSLDVFVWCEKLSDSGCCIDDVEVDINVIAELLGLFLGQ